MENLQSTFVSASANQVLREFSKQSVITQARSLSLMLWFVGSIFKFYFFYRIGLYLVILTYILQIIELIQIRLFTFEKLKEITLRTLIISFTNIWLYFSFITSNIPNPQEFGITSLSNVSNGFLVSLLFVWFSVKVFKEDIVTSDSIFRILLITLRTILRISILSTILVAIFINKNVLAEYFWIPLLAFILDPIVYAIYMSETPVVNAFGLIQFESIKSVVMSTMVIDLALLGVAAYFNGAFGKKIETFSTVYFLIIFGLLILIRNDQKYTVTNPLKSTPMGTLTEIFNQTSSLSKSNGFIITKPVSTKDGVIHLKENSLLVPLKKGRETLALVLGSGEILEKSEIKSLSGLTTLKLSGKELKQLTRGITKQSLENIDPQMLGYKNWELVDQEFLKFKGKVKNWADSLTLELSKFKSDNYGIQTEKGLTRVNLPFIKVFDSNGKGRYPKITRVQFPFFNVVQNQDSTLVDGFGLLKVIDTKLFTYVDLPGITVFDSKQGTIVRILGFRVGDKLDASLLEEIQAKVSLSSQAFEQQFSTLLPDSPLLFSFSDKGALLDHDLKPLLGEPSDKTNL